MTLIRNIFYLYVFSTNILVTKTNDFNCTCVPYYQCSDESENLIVDGFGLVDERLHAFNNTCKGYFDVCCDASKALVDTNTEPEQMFKGCGYTKSQEFPWFGTLYFQEDISKKSKYKCGVSFIHTLVAVTAAHCLNNNGIWTIRKGDDPPINAKKVIIHPSYSAGTLRNDIALIILDEPIHLIDNVGLICIPSPNIMFSNISCTVGTFDQHIDDHFGINLVSMPIIEKLKCLQKLRNTRLGGFFQLHYSFICAGGDDNKDTCEGDGGSPLVCSIAGQPGRFHQAGIVSWGIGCEENDVPGVYVNVAFFRDWIDEMMIENEFDIHSYRY